jgi:hypothetical protein
MSGNILNPVYPLGTALVFSQTCQLQRYIPGLVGFTKPEK